MIVKRYTLSFEANTEEEAKRTAEAVSIINANSDNSALITVAEQIKKDPKIISKFVKMLEHPMAGKIAKMFGIKL